MINEACDRAANSFRRLMLTLAEYRRPARTSSFTAIGQANMAQQQVISNGQNPNFENTNRSNEQGSSPAPLLPAYAEGSGLLAGIRSAEQAVGFEHRPEDASR